MHAHTLALHSHSIIISIILHAENQVFNVIHAHYMPKYSTAYLLHIRSIITGLADVAQVILNLVQALTQ